MKRGILVCGHGSRKEEGVKGLVDFAARLQNEMPEHIVASCFLDLSEPNFISSVDMLYKQGVREIIAAPAFLFGGIHVNYALPAKIDECREKYPEINILLAQYIGINDWVVKLCAQSIDKVENGIEHAQRGSHCLLTVGAGASISSANGDVAKLTRIVWENSGFGFAQYSFVSRITYPSIQDMLQLIAKMEFDRIVILPLLFFPGVYLDKIYLAAEEIKAATGTDVKITEPFGDSLMLERAMQDRIIEAEKAFL